MTCVKCDCNLTSFSDIKCTFICSNCATQLCPKSQASSLGLKDKDLKRIFYKTVQNPHFKYAPPMRLYIKDEVEYLHGIVQVERNKANELKNKNLELILKERETRLQATYVPAELINECFGDYLLKKSNRTSKSHVVQHLKSMDKALHVIDNVGTNSPMDKVVILNLATKMESSSERDIIKYLRTKKKLFDKVIQVEGIRVYSFFEEDDHPDVFEAIPSLKNEIERFRSNIKIILKKKIIESKLGEPYYVLKVCEHIIQDNEFSNIHDLFLKIQYFYNDYIKKQNRCQILKEELQDWDLDFRSDSQLCEAFVESKIDMDVEEVAAIMFITKKQFQISPMCYACCHSTLESGLRRIHEEQNCTWKQAAEKASGHIRSTFSILREFY